MEVILKVIVVEKLLVVKRVVIEAMMKGISLMEIVVLVVMVIVLILVKIKIHTMKDEKFILKVN